MNELVRIPELELTGRISCIQTHVNGTRFEVGYFFDGVKHYAWLMPEEIEKVRVKKEGKPNGQGEGKG